MKLMSGTMVDSETLSLESNALVWEIAAQRFEIHRVDGKLELVMAGFLDTTIDYLGSDTSPLAINLSTVAWTDGQRGEDIAWQGWKHRNLKGPAPSSRSVTGMMPAEALSLVGLLAGSDPIWFRNASFDGAILGNLAGFAGIKLPWHRRQHSDLYTLINLAKPGGYVDQQPERAKHSALSDCQDQIQQLVELVDRLGLLARI